MAIRQRAFRDALGSVLFRYKYATEGKEPRFAKHTLARAYTHPRTRSLWQSALDWWWMRVRGERYCLNEHDETVPRGGQRGPDRIRTLPAMEYPCPRSLSFFFFFFHLHPSFPLSHSYPFVHAFVQPAPAKRIARICSRTTDTYPNIATLSTNIDDYLWTLATSYLYYHFA